MNFMIQRFASEKDIKVMEWPLEASGRVDRELRLPTDRVGRRGLVCQARKTLIFHWGRTCFFSHPGAQHWVLLLRGRGGQRATPTPPLTKSPSWSHTAWSIGVGGSVQGLAWSLGHAVPSPPRDPCSSMPISQPAAPPTPCLIPATPAPGGILRVDRSALLYSINQIVKLCH